MVEIVKAASIFSNEQMIATVWFSAGITSDFSKQSAVLMLSTTLGYLVIRHPKGSLMFQLEIR